MKKQLIPIFCLFHFSAIFWWATPYNFGNSRLLEAYINVTGSQQYWDFFAPNSVRQHQYLSVCEVATAIPGQNQFTCQGKPLFTNFDPDFDQFQRLGSKRSRLYRLTENLIKLEDPALLYAFATYYRAFPRHEGYVALPIQLIAHRFELHPELNGLPKAGYRSDTLLLPIP